MHLSAPEKPIALERDNNTVYLVETPKTGGEPWKRIAHLGSYYSVGLGVADGRYFALLIETSGWYTVISGSVQEPMQTQHTFTIRRVGGVEHGKVWTTSPNFFYHTNTQSIFRVEVPPLE